MRRIHGSMVAIALLAVLGAASAPGIHAQNKFIYLNDNNSTSGANTVTSFQKSGPGLLPPVHTPTHGTGYASADDALRQQALYYATGAISCLFVADPKPTGTGYPKGDITSYVVNTTTGALTIPLRFPSPFGANGFSSGIGLLVGQKLLFSAYTGTNTIVVWQILPGTTGCELKAMTHITAIGLFGGFVHDMAFARLAPSGTNNRVVVTYGDGSLQSFKLAGFTLTPDCATPTNSLGHINQGSQPWGVDVTQDGMHAVFAAELFGATELGSVAVPITCATPTFDYGGPALASGLNLGAGVDTQNVWISPQEQYVYVNDVLTGQITTVTFTAGTGTVTGLAGGCPAGFANPTPPLNSYITTWIYPAGIGTAANTGTGNTLYVAESGYPSSVALLLISPSGCLKEAPGSPFVDPVSIYTGVDGLTTLTALPPRPF